MAKKLLAIIVLVGLSFSVSAVQWPIFKEDPDSVCYTTDGNLQTDCPNIKKGALLYTRAISSICDLTQPIFMAHSPMVYCIYRGKPRQQLSK